MTPVRHDAKNQPDHRPAGPRHPSKTPPASLPDMPEAEFTERSLTGRAPVVELARGNGLYKGPYAALAESARIGTSAAA